MIKSNQKRYKEMQKKIKYRKAKKIKERKQALQAKKLRNKKFK
jgi:hypothetical protein